MSVTFVFGSLKLDISNYSMGDQALSHLMAECKNKLEADGQAEAADRVARVAKLSHAQLLELAVDACEGSPELKNKADALIAQVAPLPAWCVDILMSPDLLPQLFSSLGLSEHAAAGVCSAWSRAYSRQLRRCCYN